MTSNILDHNDEIISVGELNRSAKYLLEKNFNNVSVIGEISNLSSQAFHTAFMNVANGIEKNTPQKPKRLPKIKTAKIITIG